MMQCFWHKFRRVVLGMVICLSAIPARAAEKPALFLELDEGHALRVAVESDEQVRLVGLEPAVLVRKGTDAESTFRMTLLPDLSFDAIVESTEIQGPKKYVSKGRLPWVWNSSFLFVVNDKTVSGIVDVGQRKFEIRNVPDAGVQSVYRITEIDQNALPGCGCQPVHQIDLGPVAEDQPPIANPDSGSQVDVMVVYTPSARSVVGGVANMNSQIDLAIALTNQAYQDSGVNFRVRLVHRQEVTYNESTGFDAALSALRNTSDGIVDEVHSLRNTYGADLVAMLINNNQYCGLGYLMQSANGFADWAFSVTSINCISNSTFAHEIGHNMGLHHDRDNSGGEQGIAPYSFGYRFFGNTNQQWRTIMAYAPGARLNAHSTPNRTYDGQPIGVANREDAVRSLNETAFTVANWRQETQSGAAPVINSPLTASAVVGSLFTYTITATNTPTSFGASGLPAGLSVNTSTGVISGTPTAAGNFSVTISASNSFGTDARTLALTVTTPVLPPVITSALTASGIVGSPFSYTITATNNPTQRHATGLPNGLGVNTSSGVISGTPTAAGVYNVTMTATNSAGTDSRVLVLTITNPVQPPVITSTLSVSGPAGIFFSYSIVATNSPTSYAATGLPPGLTLNTSTGVISGVPVSGNFSVGIAATNSAGSDSKFLQLSFYELPPPIQAPVITSPPTASGQVGSNFAYNITATNSPTTFSATGLPGGLTVNSVSGRISGIPAASGTYHATIRATNAAGTGSRALTITIAGAPTPQNAPVITSSLNFFGIHGSFISYQIEATNSPTSFGASGLPSGLMINSSTGLISGTAADFGIYFVSILATNAVGTGAATLVMEISGETPCDCPLTCMLDAAEQFMKGSLPQLELPWPARRLLSSARMFRDKVLDETPEGKRLIAAYYSHGCELATLLIFDPKVMLETQRLIEDLQPALAEADVTGLATVSQANWDRGWALIERLQKSASPQLNQDLEELKRFLRQRRINQGSQILVQLKAEGQPAAMTPGNSATGQSPLAWIGWTSLLVASGTWAMRRRPRH